jgi:hypothetical protein
MVFAGEPRETNAFFMIPHAGLRIGLLDRLDFGVRLAPTPLPYSTVGPGFGINLDAKVMLTRRNAPIGAAIIGGFGGSHVWVRDEHRGAFSPNAAVLLSVRASDTIVFTTMARYVFLAIPTASGGIDDNFVHIAGASFGLKIDAFPSVSVLPEVGAYWYEGGIGGERMSGPGFQYGLMLATTF